LAATLHFERLAHERNVPAHAISRGVDPRGERSLDPFDGPARDGFDVSAFVPALVSASELANNDYLILIGVSPEPEAPRTASYAETMSPRSTRIVCEHGTKSSNACAFCSISLRREAIRTSLSVEVS
jgi:hypothetical protein